MSDNKLDLNSLINQPNYKFSISGENPVEVESRLRVEEANAKHLRAKDLILHGLTSLVILVTVSLCAWLVVQKGLATDEGKLALGLLTNIVTALVAYVTGRSSK
jgi:hypothetical protein